MGDPQSPLGSFMLFQYLDDLGWMLTIHGGLGKTARDVSGPTSE